MNRQAAVAVVLVILVGFSFHCNVRRFLDPKFARTDAKGQMMLVRLDGKGPALKEMLPPHGVVGYTHDLKKWDAAEKKWVNIPEKWGDIIFNLLATQHAVAPIVVVDGVDHSLVIGNFTSASGEPH
jgi:hypothetical protein